jgi:hypothetical protein
MKGYLLAMAASAAPFASAALPEGFATFFMGSDCPSGWREVPQAKGRMIVSVNNSAVSGITVRN